MVFKNPSVNEKAAALGERRFEDSSLSLKA